MDLEHLAPTGDDEPGDIYSRLRAGLDQIREQSTRWFAMPLPGLLVRYHRIDLETYRGTWGIETEWERWAKLLIDVCDGFAEIPADVTFDEHGQPDRDLDLLLDDLLQPVTWDTLAAKIGITPDEQHGVRGLVLDVFGGPDFQTNLALHAQRVDDWLQAEASADRGRAAGGH